MPKVFSKDGKSNRVAHTASEETALVFDGYREVKTEEAKAENADKPTGTATGENKPAGSPAPKPAPPRA